MIFKNVKVNTNLKNWIPAFAGMTVAKLTVLVLLAMNENIPQWAKELSEEDW